MSIIQGNAKQGSTRGFYPKVINGSLRFNDDDSAYLSWTPASVGNRKTWTWSGWVKRGNISTSQMLLSAGASVSNMTRFWIESNDTIKFQQETGGSSSTTHTTTQVFRDPSAWYHIVLSIDSPNSTASDRIKLYINGERVTAFSSTWTPTQNWDFFVNASDLHTIGKASWSSANYLDGYLANVHFIDGQALTASDFGETKNGVWVAKDYAGTFGTNGFYLTFEDDTEVEAFNTVLYRGDGNDTQSVSGTGLTPDLVWVKNRSVGDSHVLFDSVRGFGSGKGLQSQNTAAEGANDPSYGFVQSVNSDGFTVSQGTVGDDYVNSSAENYVAWCWDAGANNAVTGHSSVTYTGNGTDNHRISGLPFTPDLIWGKKRSAAGSHFLLDSVRGVNSTLSSDTTGTEDTTADIFRGFDKDGFILGSNGQSNSSGVTYIAWAWDAGDGDPVSNTDGSITSTVKTNGDFSIISYTGNGTTGSTVGHGLSSTPDFIITKRTNTTGNWAVWSPALSGNTYSLLLNGTNAEFVPTDANYTPQNNTSFVYGLGFNSNTNSSGSDYICYAFRNVTGKQKFGTYTGNGSTSGPTVTTGFRPGWLLIKRTDSASVNGWYLYDGSRNTFSPWGKILLPNSSGAEGDNTDDLIISDTGFTLNDAYVDINASGGTYIYAAFAGSYSDYITDYNTDGSIDSRVKASDTTGFSICSYVGNGSTSTVGHGLSTTPSMIIAKTRDTATNWVVYHTSLGGDKVLQLQNTTAAQTVSGYWGTPSNTTFGVLGGGYDNNINGDNYIAYCWAEKTGYSKFGSYTANNSTNGPEVDCGFKPAFVMVKHTTKAEQWIIFDATRETTNDRSARLFPAISNAESSIPNDQGIRFLSTGEGDAFSGFKITVAGGYGINDNDVGDQYIYAAFADTREAAFWLDQSGNDNDWQPVNLDHNDTVADSPTNNFCTFNPLKKHANTVFSDGNLKVSSTDAGSAYCQFSTIVMSSGKYYAEFTINTAASAYPHIGIGDLVISENTNRGLGSANGAGYQQNGSVRVNNSTIGTFPTFTAGDVISVAYDADNNRVYFAKNGTWINSGDPTAGTGYFSPAAPVNGYVFASATYQPGSFTANFGQQPFKYDPPE